MFCQNCGFQLPDDAKFCGSCGASTEKKAETVNSASESNTYQAPRQETGGQAGYTQQTYTQQSYAAPKPAAYSVPVAKPQGKFRVSTLVILGGGALGILGYFLPLVSSYGMGISLMEMSFGTGMASYLGVSYIPLAAFLAAGILAIVFAFLKPGLAIISAVLGIGGFVYLFLGTGSTDFTSLLEYAGIGFWLTAISVVAVLTGSIMGMAKK